MTRKITTAVIFLLTVCLLLSSCGYRLKLEKVEDGTEASDVQQAEQTDGQSSVQSGSNGQTVSGQTDASGQAVAPEITTAAESSTLYDLDDGTPLGNNSDYVRVALNTDKVLELYRTAMNDVKNNKPGFKRTETQTTSDVTAGSGRTQLANGILNLVGQSILGSDNSNVTVSKGDSESVKNLFPIYGSDKGCELISVSLIKSAECWTNGKDYRIIIKLNDVLNPEQDSEFAKIIKPADFENIKNGISEYLVVLDYSQYQFDMNYSGCEITCIIDKSTSRMSELTQKSVAKVDININLDLVVLKTSAVKCSGTITDEVIFTDFVW